MSPKAPFLNKVLNRLDRLDKEAIRNYVVDLARRAENYHEILNRIPVGIILIFSDKRIQFINDQALHWLGLIRNDISEKKKIEEIIPDAGLRNFFSAGMPDKIHEDMRIYEPREMDLRLVMMPLDGTGENNTLCVLLDNTVEKTRDRESERAARHESLFRMAAGIAHEIGNPLNSINIHLNLLQREVAGLSEGRTKDFLSRTSSILLSETKRLDGIVRNFLKAARRPPLRFKYEDLNNIAREAIDFFRPELEGKGISIYLQPDDELPQFLMDRQRLHEIFVNLIKNALEAMPEGGAIKVSISHKKKVCIIRVKDQGTGIKEEDLGHIFEAYYTTKKEGSGLGLMLVFDAVSEHGGRIEVDTKLDKGTTFTILLPIREPKLQLPRQN